MRGILILLYTVVLLTGYIYSQSLWSDSPEGFASVNALGQNGTNGGFGGDTVYFSDGNELNSFFLSRKDARFDKNYPPNVVIIRGKLTYTEKEMMDIKETYDLTIIGEGDDAHIEGFGFNIFRSHNIIIRNILFNDCPDDGINITDSLSHHIWIDHCSFTDSPAVDPNGNNHDGLLDTKHGANYITISWNHFSNHQKTCLVGASDNNAAENAGKLKITYHHNWFDNTGSRHPRVRFGDVHVYNNYYDGRGSMSYGIASTMEANVVVEANYFKNVPNPTHAGYAASGPGDVAAINNVYINSGAPETRGESFSPGDYYSYSTDEPGTVPELLMKYAGSGKLNIMVPVELTSFTASAEGNSVILKWSTATENNNFGFEVQRAFSEELNWEAAAFIKGNGTSAAIKEYSYKDNLQSAGKYHYRLKQIDYDGSADYSQIIVVEFQGTISEFRLSPNYPNPFNPETILEYEVPYSSYIIISVYDVLGNKISDLVNEKKSQGNYKILFNAEDLPSGTYLIKLTAGSHSLSSKILLVK